MRLGSMPQLDEHINVTPMIDVLLVLLVIFMLAIQVRLMLSINVPPPSESGAQHPAPQVVLDLKADGSYALNGTAVTIGGLRARLRELYEGTRRNVLFVHAAPQRRYGEVIAAVDIARGAGVPIIGYMP